MVITGVGNGNPLRYSCMENSMEEPGRLQFAELQRAGHDWATEHNNDNNSIYSLGLLGPLHNPSTYSG